MSATLVVNEIYLSLQGESTWAGLPCIFVRLTGCNLRCSYCDTAYAFSEGKKMSLADIQTRIQQLAQPFVRQTGNLNLATADQIERQLPKDGELEMAAEGGGMVGVSGGINSRLPLVELTGGEPLLQSGSLELMKALADHGFTVLLETSGAWDIAAVDARICRIMDLKCPSSGEAERNRWENLAHLRGTDEIKFVVSTWEDYAWMKAQIARLGLAAICPVLVSWAAPLMAGQRHPSLKTVLAGAKLLTRAELAERIIADALPVRYQLQMHKYIWPSEMRGV